MSGYKLSEALQEATPSRADCFSCGALIKGRREGRRFLLFKMSVQRWQHTIQGLAPFSLTSNFQEGFCCVQLWPTALVQRPKNLKMSLEIKKD